MAKKQAILDMIADGDISITEASKLFGINANTIYQWRFVKKHA